jgi:hypothetical protein
VEVRGKVDGFRVARAGRTAARRPARGTAASGGSALPACLAWRKKDEEEAKRRFAYVVAAPLKQ